MMNTVARGNIGQLVAAANHLLIRGEGVHNSEYQIPDVSSGQLAEGLGVFGPVAPTSQSVIAPTFNNGATDSWGHDMPATLTYKWDRNTNGLVWDRKEAPFQILQRTPHELLLNAADINHNERQINPKTKEINALSPKVTGEEALNTDINKSDDYEPTGVFETKIEPAHIVKDLDDMDELRGFSGDWVVQKKPKGDRVFVKKTGKSIEPMSMTSKV